jgi:hypothetical protein
MNYAMLAVALMVLPLPAQAQSRDRLEWQQPGPYYKPHRSPRAWLYCAHVAPSEIAETTSAPTASHVASRCFILCSLSSATTAASNVN